MSRPATDPTLPHAFTDIAWLERHIQHTMAFYYPRCADAAGGHFNFFLDDGTVYDAGTRHLVSSTRYVVNFARMGLYFKRPELLAESERGLAYLAAAHQQSATGGWAWLLRDGKVIDGTNHGYGLAFVILAHAEALKAGLASAKSGLDRALALLDARFWLPDRGLIVDEYNADFSVLSPYRGQNANMHLCEAMIAAFEATGDDAHLNRALRIADAVTGGLATQGESPTKGLVWEHYTPDWQIDWNYNLDDPKHLFRPWGFQPGHQTEWAKLLLMLQRYQPDAALIDRARFLFDAAWEKSWDSEHGGMVYGFAPDGKWCDTDKYFWVQAESFAAAAMLAEATDDARYWTIYRKLWDYAWRHFVDHEHGAWYRILTRDNRKYSNEKSPAGKVDYHTIGATLDAIHVLKRLQANGVAP